MGLRLRYDAEELGDAGVVEGGVAGGLTAKLSKGRSGGRGWRGVGGKLACLDGDWRAGEVAAVNGAEGAAAETVVRELDLRRGDGGRGEGCRGHCLLLGGGGLVCSEKED